MKFEAEIDGELFPIEVTEAGPRYRVRIAEETHEVDARQVGEGVWSLLIGGEAGPAASRIAAITAADGQYVVEVEGERFGIAVEEETRWLLRTHGGTAHARGQVLKAPMPGRVVHIGVAVGQAVAAGTGLLVLEAMKMQNEFKAAAAGVVVEIRAAVGQTVNAGDVLVVIE
ncbi:MAG: hypothetical protein L0027_14020 [Candidatus Rokubacteria bacterium]|nr:hypothetical protein [Candidatus Rokubacteria bacterium]